MNKTYFFLLCFFSWSFSFFGQVKSSNEYIPENFDAIKSYLVQINDKQLNRISGPYSSKIKKIYEDHDRRIVTAIEDSVYFFNPNLKDHLDSILESVYVASEPFIDHSDFYFFIKNSITPNAGCYGDGTYEISLGLFTSYDADDELAFVICHEIAHDILDHSYNKISNVIEELNSKDTKQKIKEVDKKKYGKTRAGLALLDELNTDFLKHSKEVEAQADSLGFVLFQKTKYNPQRAITALEKLKVTDNSFFDFPVKLDSVFNFNDYPFKKFWLEEEISIFTTDEKINDFKMSSEDLKTHPEIDYRIEKLENEFSIPKKEEVAHFHIQEISKIATAQSVKYTIDLNVLDLAIYQLIRKFQLGKIDQEFYYSSMASVFVKIYEAKKNHELGRYVPRKNNFSEEKELNRIRLFLHNLELSEVRNIGYLFCQEALLKTNQNELINQSLTFFKP